MKKIYLVLAMLAMACVAFVGCAQSSDPDLTKDDLNDTSWLIGTWETSYDDFDCSYSIDGGSDTLRESLKAEYDKMVAETKASFEKQKSAPAVKTVITNDNVATYAAYLKGQIALADNPTEVSIGNNKTSSSVSVKTNKDKTSITLYGETIVTVTVSEITVTESTTMTMTMKKVE